MWGCLIYIYRCKSVADLFEVMPARLTHHVPCVRDRGDGDPELPHGRLLKQAEAPPSARKASISQHLDTEDGKVGRHDLEDEEFVESDHEPSVQSISHWSKLTPVWLIG